MYKAEVIADSISPLDQRLTTLRVTMPRIILAEFNTHRVLSKNSASSRAIPFKSMVESVRTDPFIPLKWQKDHSGMQGNAYVTNLKVQDFRKGQWLRARDRAVAAAEGLNGQAMKHYAGSFPPEPIEDGEGITKQLCNRLLEPFMWHTLLVSGTEWENFFALRAHPAAEIHMQHVAELMLEAMNSSVPVKVSPGGWHIPFKDRIIEILDTHTFTGQGEMEDQYLKTALKISTMMCARTSYTVPGNELSEWTVEKYVEKHDMMVKSGHWSPFEHCAKATGNPWFYSNFNGWEQYRKTFAKENQIDNRLIKHTYASF